MTTRDQPLSRDEILDTALAIVDDDGFKALTMRRLANRLDVVPMALYRHVANKGDLVSALLDEASARVSLPPAGLGWRAGLTALAAAIRAETRSHPGLVTPLVNSPSLGPHALGIAEYGYAVMTAAGFDDDDIRRGVNAVITYTLGFAALETPRSQAVDGTTPPDLDGLDAAYARLDPGAFPHTLDLRPRAAELVSGEQFTYGLERLLDGLAARLDRP